MIRLIIYIYFTVVTRLVHRQKNWTRLTRVVIWHVRQILHDYSSVEDKRIKKLKIDLIWKISFSN